MSKTVEFPDIPLYKGWNKPYRLESKIQDLEVIQGSIPVDIDGYLCRCGGDRQYPPMFEEDIFLDGEGMVHQFKVKDGHVDYQSRWVRTERFLLQEKARRSLFGRYRNRYTNDPSVEGKNQGTANTSVSWHGGKMLVLKEDSHPVEINPHTLETIGEWDYNGALKAESLSAHPKLDLHSNELLTFSYQAKGDGTTDFAFYIIDKNGEIDHEMWFNMPYAAMVHDFSVTDTHIIVPFFPMMTDMDVVKQGGPYYQWHPDKQTHCAVFPRRGKTEDIRWFTGSSMSAGHMLNAFKEGSSLHLDLCLYESNCFPFFPDATGAQNKPCLPFLTRLSFDLDSDDDQFKIRQLNDVPSEMPQVDERFMGKPYTHGYTLCFEPPRATSYLGHLNVKTGEFKIWHPGENSSVQEPQFIPRHKGAAEGDGYILILVNRTAEMRSDLAILDAQKIEDGPVALIAMPNRVRASFHGCWAPGDALASGLYSV